MSGVDGKALDRILKTEKVFLWRTPSEFTNQPKDVSLRPGHDRATFRRGFRYRGAVLQLEHCSTEEQAQRDPLHEPI